MKTTKQFIIGSNVFFTDYYDDYISHDIDELHIMDNWSIKNTNVLNFKNNGKDIFYFKDMSKQEFINDTLMCNTPMRVGKFLVPEFAQHLNMTIDDLKQLKPMIDKLDDKHKYEQMIYDFYIENNDFILTEKQRDIVYDEYKKYRR